VSALPASLVLVGAGKMGGAMIEGWLALGLDGARASLFDPQPSPAVVELCRSRGLRLNPPVVEAARPEVLVLAVKPQMLDAASALVTSLLGEHTLLVSVLAGKRIADLAGRLPSADAIVRAMPNTPAAVGRGITGAFPNAAVLPAQRTMADTLLRAVGQVEWLQAEDDIDGVTAVSGSGPAYVFLLTECMAAAGVALGLEPGLAARLARATVEGAAELMHRSPDTLPATLRQNVTSPAGTTAAALEVLMAGDGLAPLMAKAIAAARRRAEELSG
jgi:pyrroline-5-carboxylate reductase